MKIRLSVVATIIPPKTVVPTETRPAAPAPQYTSFSNPPQGLPADCAQQRHRYGLTNRRLMRVAYNP
jgi:hypothetical protein